MQTTKKDPTLYKQIELKLYWCQPKWFSLQINIYEIKISNLFHSDGDVLLKIV